MALRLASTLVGREAGIALRRVHLQPEARQGAGKTDQHGSCKRAHARGCV